jgi:Ca2+-binding RTX toxin-like protein
MSITYVTTLVNQNQTVSYTNAQGQGVSVARSMEVRLIVPDVPGNYPIVFYSHGHSAVPAGSGSLNAKALADLGYIVVLPTHLDSSSNPAAIRDAFPLENPASTLHRVADMKHAFDQLPALMPLVPGYTADTSTPVIAGHSHGSWTSYLLTGVIPQDPAYTSLPAGNPYGLTGLVDTRFKASIVLSPPGNSSVNDVGPGFSSASWNGYTMPSLSLTGTLDATALEPAYAMRLAGFELAPAQGKYAVVLRNADHFQIGGFSASLAQTTALAQAMDAFLDAYVRGEANRLMDPASVLQSNSLYSEVMVRSGATSVGELRGLNMAEALSGYATSDLISGFDGADTLAGLGGNDTLKGGAGADVLQGGSGTDTASYAGATAGIQVVMYDMAYSTGEAAGDSLSEIEAVQGSAQVDILVGDFLANMLLGGDGGDWLDGTYGGDALHGQSGSDSLVSRQQADVLDGGADFDFARYDYADAALRAFLYDPSLNTGWAAGDTLVSVEGLAGSYFGDDLRGDGGQNIIYGLGGADFIIGLDGADLLIGGDGQDLFHFVGMGDGGAGGDVIQDFASGTDRISVTGAFFGLGSPGGVAIESWRFVSGSAATLATSQFIYNIVTRELFYDQDGTGVGAQVLLVTLQAGATVAAGDIIVI